MPSLRIISVNDVYALANLPRLATLVRHHREVNPSDAFLVVLAGDFLAPSILSSLDFGAGMVDCLNAIGFTHVIFGNHEDDVPVEELEKRVAEFRGTWLDANAHALGGKLPKTDIVEVGPLRVGLVGVVTSNPSLYRDVPFGSRGLDPPNDVALRERDRLCRLSPPCAAVIAVTHQSMTDDRALAAQGAEPGPDGVRFSPFPVILGGHEHVPFLERIGPTWIVKAGSDATNAAVIDIAWTSAVSEATVRIELEPVAKYAEDAALRARVDLHMTRVRELETSTLVVLPRGQSLSSVGTRRQQTSLGTLVCTLIRDTLGAEVGLLNGGGLRGARTYERHFTYGDLRAEAPFDNELVVVSLPGHVLGAAIAASRIHAPAESGAYLQVDDLVVLDPATNELRSVYGAPFDPNRHYAVALVRNFLVGLDHIEPLVRFAAEDPARLPEVGAGRDVKQVLVEAFARSLYRGLGTFDAMDQDHDGRVTKAELEDAIALATHEPASRVVTDIVMAALDQDHDDVLSRSESDAARGSPKPRSSR